MKPSLFPLALATVLVACTQSEAPAATQAASASGFATTAVESAESFDANRHVLTKVQVDAFFAVQRNFAAAIAADPSLDPAIDVSEEDGAAYAARMDATPALREAITSAGISVRNYAMTSEALLNALMAQGALDAGLLRDLPDGVSPQHLEFVRTHKADIEAQLQDLG